MPSALASLSALGHESRLRAFRRLVEAGPDGPSFDAMRLTTWDRAALSIHDSP